MCESGDGCAGKGKIMKKNYDFSRGKRGAIISPDPAKVRITIRLDGDIVKKFKEQVHKAGGGNYQSLINQALREYLEISKGTLERTLRRIIRQELQTAA